MQLGLQLSSLTPYLNGEENIASTLKKVADMGYRYVQLQGIPDETDNDFLADTLKQNGLLSVAVQADYSFGLEGHAEKIIERSVVCGAEYLSFALIPREVDSVQSLSDFAVKVRRIGENVEKAGLKFSFHPIGCDYALLDGIPRYERLLTLLPELGLTFCVSAAFSSPVRVEEVFEKFTGRIDLVHFKEYVTLSDGQRQLVPLGEGEHDWKLYYELCQKNHVPYIFAEQESWQGDAFDAVRASYHYLRKWVNNECTHSSLY
ncbi:MAG: sugar phosphate isomerase/epimerase family protein [Faecalispora jeddahensis]